MVVAVVVVAPGERRANQLAIRKALLFGGFFGWYGVEDIFHIAPPARGAAEYATTQPSVTVGIGCDLTVRYHSGI